MEQAQSYESERRHHRNIMISAEWGSRSQARRRFQFWNLCSASRYRRTPIAQYSTSLYYCVTCQLRVGLKPEIAFQFTKLNQHLHEGTCLYQWLFTFRMFNLKTLRQQHEHSNALLRGRVHNRTVAQWLLKDYTILTVITDQACHLFRYRISKKWTKWKRGLMLRSHRSVIC
jgi:hypothetical protein